MSAYNLLSELRQAGVVVKASGTDRLVVDAPKGALTPEMRAALAEHKKELLAILSVTGDQPAPEAAQSSRPSLAQVSPVVPDDIPYSGPDDVIESAVAVSVSPEPSDITSSVAPIAAAPTENIEDKIRRLEQEAAQLRAQQEARRAEIEARQRRENEIKQLEEEAAQVAVLEGIRASELQALRQAEEEKWQAAVAAQKKTAEEAELREAEEERRAAQLEARRHAEEEIARRRSEEEIRKVEEQLASLRADEVNRRAEVTARWQAEDERWRAELENRRIADEHVVHQFAEVERQRVENENKYKAQDEEAKRKAELRVASIKEQVAVLRAEQESFSAAEALRKAEEDASRRAAEEAARREQEMQLHAAEVVRQKAEEEARRRAVDDARRADEEARAAEQEARLRALEEERKELEEKARREAEISAQKTEPEWFQVNMDEVDTRGSGSLTPLTLPDAGSAAAGDSEGTFIDYQEFESSLQVHPTANLPASSGGTKEFHLLDAEQADKPEHATPSAVSNTTLSMLSSENVSERCAAVTALPQLGGEDAFAHISTAFDDPAVEVRNAAARAMFGFQTDRAASFTRALREGSPDRRRKIGAALASSGLATEAIGNLTGESREKTYDAFSLLFLMSKAGEVQPLLRAIEEHSNVEVRLAVVKLLALSGQHEILPAFRRLAVRGSLPPEVRSSVMEAIYQISSQSTADAHSAA